MKDVNYWQDKLEMSPHPEGGFYRETYRSLHTMTTDRGVRNLATSIFYLLAGNDQSHFHRLDSDEIWYYQHGQGVVVHQFYQKEYSKTVLSPDHEMQLLIPKGSIFAAEVLERTGYVLVGCMVNPGFDFSDFHLVDRAEMMNDYPDFKELITQFTLDT
jgi:hypothetical protein